MQANKVSKKFLSLTVFLALAACVPTATNRSDNITEEANSEGWTKQVINAGVFQLTAFLSNTDSQTDTIYIYIEGDGMAWIDSATPSSNPTPLQPVALRLAMRHGSNAAYIARPCQYTIRDPACSTSKWWTSDRFALSVIESTSSAVDTIKKNYNATKVILVGYSGGGARLQH